MTKRFRIEWAPVAQADLDELLEYITEQDSVDAAIHVYEKIMSRIDALGSNPLRYRVPSELQPHGVRDYREVIVAPYSVFIRVSGRTIGIIGVLDRRRDLQEILVERALRPG
ncbi:MAG: type II toxin-antitoxin system RelE/ParE family toxin [Verrucomicrobia bacterium]|nr:type II toxin-antitoxin system RelE/ParE family toxin [Verrucomicrobiota bacterium]MDA1086696.1 type II toxin-antitoxin system RelE/ParE family toxin [Verrucomicrobiota bacterium]